MATKYLRNTGSTLSWHVDSSWSTTSAKDSTRESTGNTVAPTTSDDVVIDDYSGNCSVSSYSTGRNLNMTGYAGTLSGGTGVILNGGSSMVLSGTITNTGSWEVQGTYDLTSNGSTLQTLNINFVHGSPCRLLDNWTFRDSKTTGLGLSTSGSATTLLNLNGKTLSGYSGTSRLLIKCNTLGTRKTIQVSGGSFANADFRDIALDTPTDLSAITGGSGDCGGNSNITFTPSVDVTWAVNTGGNWSDVANWDNTGDDRVPLPQDDVILGNASMGAGQTITADMPRLGRDIDFTGVANTPAFTLGNAVTSYGSVNLTGMGTNSFGQTWTFESQQRSSTITLTSAGKSFGAQVNISVPNTIFQLQDAFSNTGGNVFSGVTIGTFDANGNNVTSARLGGTGGSIIMGSGTWTANTTTATATAWAGSGVSITANSSTILFVNAANTATTFAGGGNTYNNLTTNSGTGGVTITGSNTFNNITVPAAGVLTLTAGTTQNVNTFTGTGTSGAGNCVSLRATAGVVPILNKLGGGVINNDWMCIQGVNVTPANTWYYGSNSKDGLGIDFNGEAAAGGVVSSANDATKNQSSGSTSFSVEVWSVHRTVGSTAGRFVDHADATALTVGYSLFLNNATTLTFSIGEGGAAKNTTTNASAIVANSLNHVVTSWTSGSAPKIYINNSEAGGVGYSSSTAVTTPGNDSGNTLNFGNWSGQTRTFDGQIFLVRIYRNVALTSTEVTSLYNGGVLDKNLSNSATAKATQVWKLNEGTGNTSSVSGETGTVTSPAYWANTGWKEGTGYDMTSASGCFENMTGLYGIACIF